MVPERTCLLSFTTSGICSVAQHAPSPPHPVASSSQCSRGWPAASGPDQSCQSFADRSPPHSQLWLPAQARSAGDQQMEWAMVNSSAETGRPAVTRMGTISGRRTVIGMPGDATQWSVTGLTAASRIIVTVVGSTGCPQSGTTGTDRLSRLKGQARAPPPHRHGNGSP